MVLKICRVLVLVALSLSVFAALFGCAGCVIERDPIDLCPNLDEMIRCLIGSEGESVRIEDGVTEIMDNAGGL